MAEQAEELSDDADRDLAPMWWLDSSSDEDGYIPMVSNKPSVPVVSHQPPPLPLQCDAAEPSSGEDERGFGRVFTASVTISQIVPAMSDNRPGRVDRDEYLDALVD